MNDTCNQLRAACDASADPFMRLVLADAYDEAGEHALAEFYRMPPLLGYTPSAFGPSFLHFVWRFEETFGRLPTPDEAMEWLRQNGPRAGQPPREQLGILNGLPVVWSDPAPDVIHGNPNAPEPRGVINAPGVRNAVPERTRNQFKAAMQRGVRKAYR
jgi:hypothetical protein